MKVEVKLFALARQLVGRDSIEVELPETAAVGDLRQRVAQEHPQLAPLVAHATFAIGSRYADDRQPIPAGAEVACIPPVSGG